MFKNKVPIVRSRYGETVNNKVDSEMGFFSIGIHLVGLLSVKHLSLSTTQLASAVLTTTMCHRVSNV